MVTLPVRTGRVDGFVVDRGFQVLNTAYRLAPELHQAPDADWELIATRDVPRALAQPPGSRPRVEPSGLPGSAS